MPENLKRRSSLTRVASISEARVAVLVPCYNEEATIGKVIQDFHQALPEAEIYVYDNNSTDRTSDVATECGATVRVERMQGKGNVVRRMFSDVEADIYVMVDGDDTYDAGAAWKMVEMCLEDGLDMVVGRRIDLEVAAYRPGHRLGNIVLTETVTKLFGKRFSDMLSGYRVFSRRFAKSFPVLSQGFEIETEITVHALNLRMPIREIDTLYRSRPEGSVSKLRTYRDGFKILGMIFGLVRGERPLFFFGTISAILALLSIVLGLPVVSEFLRTGLVLRFPTAILATGIAVLSALSLVCAFILDTVTRGRRTSTMLAYLAVPQWNNARRA